MVVCYVHHPFLAMEEICYLVGLHFFPRISREWSRCVCRPQFYLDMISTLQRIEKHVSVEEGEVLHKVRTHNLFRVVKEIFYLYGETIWCRLQTSFQTGQIATQPKVVCISFLFKSFKARFPDKERCQRFNRKKVGSMVFVPFVEVYPKTWYILCKAKLRRILPATSYSLSTGQ